MINAFNAIVQELPVKMALKFSEGSLKNIMKRSTKLERKIEHLIDE